MTKKQRKSHMQIICRKDDGFVSRQLPKGWKHHKGSFDPQGRPRFKNHAEAHEATARARGEEGTEIHYDEL